VEKKLIKSPTHLLLLPNIISLSFTRQPPASVDDLHRFLGKWFIGRPVTFLLRREKLEMTELSSKARA
jgi:hypothetical protein